MKMLLYVTLKSQILDASPVVGNLLRLRTTNNDQESYINMVSLERDKVDNVVMTNVDPYSITMRANTEFIPYRITGNPLIRKNDEGVCKYLSFVWNEYIYSISSTNTPEIHVSRMGDDKLWIIYKYSKFNHSQNTIYVGTGNNKHVYHNQSNDTYTVISDDYDVVYYHEESGIYIVSLYLDESFQIKSPKGTSSVYDKTFDETFTINGTVYIATEDTLYTLDVDNFKLLPFNTNITIKEIYGVVGDIIVYFNGLVLCLYLVDGSININTLIKPKDITVTGRFIYNNKCDVYTISPEGVDVLLTLTSFDDYYTELYYFGGELYYIAFKDDNLAVFVII